MANYYDIHDILMQDQVMISTSPFQFSPQDADSESPSFQPPTSPFLEQNVSTVFLHKANGAGFLDPSSEDNNVARGSVVDLPLWLAQDLVQRQIVHVKLPSCFNARVRKEVQADPACIDLRSKCPFYYEMGCKLVELNVDPTLGPYLLHTLQGRYKDLLLKALTTTLTGNPKFVPLLTEEETRLFEAGRDSMKAFRKWRLQGPRLERAAILGRKRTRDSTPIWS